MEIKDYELLLAMEEYKNMTTVSRVLYVTQPAITKRIHKMEEELQCALFLRSQKGMLLTAAGEAILPIARKIVAENQKTPDIAASTQGEVCGTLQLGVSIEFSRYHLPDLLKTYTDHYPKVDIKIICDRSRNLVQLLNRGELSMAVVRGEFDFDGASEQIDSENLFFVCSEENKERSLKEYPFIWRKTDNDYQDKIHLWMAQNGLSGLHSKFQIDDISTCKELIKRGIAWGILPEICLGDFDGFKRQLLLEGGQPITRNTYVLYREPVNELRQVQIFLDELRKLQ